MTRFNRNHIKVWTWYADQPTKKDFHTNVKDALAVLDIDMPTSKERTEFRTKLRKQLQDQARDRKGRLIIFRVAA